MNRSNLLLTLVLIGLIGLIGLASAQVDTAWVRRYDGPPGTSYDDAQALAVDGAGNVYVTGKSVGIGTDNDYATIKYNSAGVQQWIARYNGPVDGYDEAHAIAVDGSGNVYVTGRSVGPSGTGLYDYATIKYNSAGDTLWVRRYDGPGNGHDEAYRIAVDGSGNIYVTGQSMGATSFDYATIKYNSAGDTLWVRRYDGPGNDVDCAFAIAVDGAGNVYVTGQSVGISWDYATIKYNSAGDTLWVRRYIGPGITNVPSAIAVDGTGNVYVTGKSILSGLNYDYATIKYNSAGVEQWVGRYNPVGTGADYAYALAVDALGNVYVTGSSKRGLVFDYATIKYNSAGDTLWVRRYNSGTGTSSATALAVDGTGNVYVTGLSSGSGTSFDYATIKYNAAGDTLWLRRYNGPPGNGDDKAYAIAVDASGNVYITGQSTGSGTGLDYATIKYIPITYTITIGTGTSTQRWPIGIWYGYERSSSIYLVSEIGGSGQITDLRWYCATAVGATAPVVVYMKTTSATTQVAETWASAITGATTVYTGTVSYSATGWAGITLSTPFTYTATTSTHLQVLVEANYGDGGISPYYNWNYTTASASRHQYWATDNTPPTTNGTTSTSLPNIQLVFSSYTPGDFAPPAISYTPLGAITGSIPPTRTLTATITDATGVPTSGPLQPRIYYRKGTGTWYSSQGVLTSGTGQNGTWDFTITHSDMGGIAGGDIVYYYAIAQDQASPINIGSNPPGVVATDVNTVTTPPAIPNQYSVVVVYIYYSFQAASGTFTPLTGATVATLSGGSLDDGYYNNIPIGFPFSYNGINYSWLSAGTNGWSCLEGLNPSSLSNNLTSGTPRPILAPLWDDENMALGQFSYKTDGTAPNRVFTAEWLNNEWYYGSSYPNISFQVKLYEASRNIEFIYRRDSTPYGSPSASIGITAIGTGSGNFLSLDGTGTNPNASPTLETNTLSTAPATGQIYRFVALPVPPIIIHTPLTSTDSTVARLVTATITSTVGLAGAPNQPRVYYRSGTTGAYSFVTMTNPSGNNWQANIPGYPGGTTVQYYIAAQDTLSTPLVTTSPAGGSGANPPGTTPPSSPYFYNITNPLTGIKYIVNGITATDTYPSFTAAINDLNSNSVGAGGVTFNVPANQTFYETPPIITASGTSTNPIVFQKTGSFRVNPLIIPNTAGTKTTGTIGYDGDAIIKIGGGDYITFDAIDVQDTFSLSATVCYEYGYMTAKMSATDACKNVTIRNCGITLNKLVASPGYSAGICISNVDATGIAITVTSTGGRSENISIYSNMIANAWHGIVTKGYAASTPYDFYDQNIYIGDAGGNSITNYGGGATATAYGVYAIYANNIRINNNTINNIGGAPTTTTLRAIYMSTGALANVDIINNDITLRDSATTSSMYGIENAAAGNIVRIKNNVVHDMAYPAATSGAMYGIVNSGAAVAVYMDSNIVRNCVLPGTGAFYGMQGGSPTNLFMRWNNVYANKKTGASGTMYLTHAATAIIRYMYNNIYGDSIPATSGTSAATIYGYYNLSSPLVESLAYNNIHDLVIAGATTSTSTLINGMYTYTVSSAYKWIYNNNIYTTSTHIGTTYGIRTTVGTVVNIYNNNIYDMKTGAVGGITYGVYITSGTTINAWNNMVYDLRAPAATGTNAVNGLYISGGTAVNAYYNTIFLNDTSSSSTTYGNTAIYASTTPIVTLRNNVAVNLSKPGATGGFIVAYRRSTTTLTTYATASNNNCLFAGVPAANQLIYYDGTNSDLTLAAFKTRVAPKDAYSVTELPPFVNVATRPYDIHINTAIATRLESGAQPIPGITTDIDGDTRVGSTDVHGNVLPDIGADEFSGIPIDEIGPTITYTPLLNTGSLTNRNLTATISDLVSGVSVEASRRPTLFFNKNRGTWYQDSLFASPWIFTIDVTRLGGVLVGDSIFYYVSAYDSSGNVSVNPSTAPTISNYYIITQASLSGNYTVGLALFNKLTGRNIYFEKSVRKVMREVQVFDVKNATDPLRQSFSEARPQSHREINPANNRDNAPPEVVREDMLATRTEWVEVEEISYIPMENGKPYTGDLYVKKSENPEISFPEGIRGDYATITAAVADLNLRGVSGPTNFLLTDASYTTGETYPIIINVTNEMKPTALNRVTIKPNTGMTSVIAGASASAQIFRIVSSYITIDGSNSGGTDRSLTIQNTSITSPQVITISPSGTTPTVGVTLKNCVIINGANTSTAVIVGNPGYFNNITIQNNSIQLAYIGVYVKADPVVSGNGSGTLLTGNDLNTAGANSIRLVGVYVQGVDGATVSNNNISNMSDANAESPKAIWFATATNNGTISGNTISNLALTNTGAYALSGIYISSGATATSINITNNSISNLTNAGTLLSFTGILTFTPNTNITNNTVTNMTQNGAAAFWGIVCSGNINANVSGNTVSGLTTATSGEASGLNIQGLSSGVNVFKNNVYNVKNTNSGGWGSNGIYLSSSSTTANINVYNNFVWDIAAYGYAAGAGEGDNGYGMIVTGGAGYNIYYNSVSMNTNQTAEGLPAAFNVTSGVTATGALDVRNNIFANSQTIGTQRYAIYSGAANTVFSNIDYNDYITSGPNLGYIGATNRADLTAWRTGTGQDMNSISADPMFTSSSDLHIPLTVSSPINRAATPISGITVDIDNEPRNPTRPDIGADEYTPTPPQPFSLISPLNNTINQPLTGQLVWGKSTFAQYYDVYLDTLPSPINTISHLQIDTTYNYPGLLRGKWYYWKVAAYNDTGVALPPGNEYSAQMSDVWSFRAINIDVGCTKIIAPTGTFDSIAFVVPACSLYNFGTTIENYTVRMKIGGIYNNTFAVTNHAAGTYRVITFPNWIVQRGSYAVTCSTELATDMYPNNDKATGQVTVTARDVATTMIVSPTGILLHGTLVPVQAKVKNFGTNTESFTVRFKIGGIYTRDTTVTNLGSRDSVLVSFAPWVAVECNYVTSCSTMLAADQVPTNNKMIGSVLVLRHDVGATRILFPIDTAYGGNSIIPKARIKNFGYHTTETFDVTFKIGAIYTNTKTVTNLGPRDSLDVLFDPWTAVVGNYNMMAYTALPGDQQLSNDTVYGTLPVAQPRANVGTIAILAPKDTIPTNVPIAPRAIVMNYGSNPATFPVRFRIIGTSYNQVVTVQSLASQAQLEVVFPSWTPIPCNYVTSCSTELATDQTPENDKMTGSVTVQLRDVGIATILAPRDTVISCNDYQPMVVVGNYGIHAYAEMCTVSVRIIRYPAQMESAYCNIGVDMLHPVVVYDTWKIVEIPVGVETLSFPIFHPYWWDIYWIAKPTYHLVSADIKMAGDMNTGNDHSQNQFTVKGRSNDLEMNWTGLVDGYTPKHSETLTVNTYNVASVVTNSPMGPTAKFRTRVKIVQEKTNYTVYNRCEDRVLPARTYSCVGFQSGWSPSDTGWYLVRSWVEALPWVDSVVENNAWEKHYYFTSEPVAKSGGETNQSIQSGGITGIPTTFTLMANKPNPFSSHTTIQWQIPVNSKVMISIYDATGRIVKTLVNNEFTPGYYNTTWNRTDDNNSRIPAGIYFYEMRANDYTSRHKMVITH